MNILDEWGLQDTSLDGYSAYPSHDAAISASDQYGESLMEGPPRTAAAVEVPIFTVETVERNVGRSRGQVALAAAASDSVVLVTNRNFLLRYDMSTRSSTPVAEVELSRAVDWHVVALHLDPQGLHALLLCRSGGQAEGHYWHARWRKTRTLPRLKGVAVTAVGWDGLAGSEGDTGPMVLGTQSGCVYGMALEERDKREKNWRQLYDLSANGEAVAGLSQHHLEGDGNRARLRLLLATASRLFVFVGGPTVDEMFARYPDDVSELTNLIELRSQPGPAASLLTFCPPGSHTPSQLAWVNGSGVFTAALQTEMPALDQQDDAQATPNGGGADPAPQRELSNLQLSHLLSWETLGAGSAGAAAVAVGLSEYHLLVLSREGLAAFNVVSQQRVQEVALGGRGPASGLVYGLGKEPLGLMVDAASGALYVYTGDDLIEVVVTDEGRHMWRMLLDQGHFVAAFAACRNQSQRDAVNQARAERCFEDGLYEDAAKFFGKVLSSSPSFEEVALKFVGVGEVVALQTFLLTKLELLSSADRAQSTMVATWLTELMLDQINRELLEEGGQQGERYKELVDGLNAFLKRHVAVLDPNVTNSLLLSYGRLEEVMALAAVREDHETLLDYLLQKGDAVGALAVLRRPSVSQELCYKYAPELVALAPGLAVDAFMSIHPPLDPRRLLPAVVRCGESGSSPALRAAAIRLVEYYIHRLSSTDRSVHNLAVALYSQEPDEKQLLDYLKLARDPLGAPLFDPKYALRLVRERQRIKATVSLLCEVGLVEDALALSLGLDMDLALAVANQPLDNPPLQRKLWLAVARHIIAHHYSAAAQEPQGQGVRVRAISEFLKESGGVVSIEDLLPLFPDFMKIDDFKDAICSSLEEYNTQIDRLKREMEDATRIADALRRDMVSLGSRTATLDLAEPCAACSRPLHQPPPPLAGPSGGSLPLLQLFPSGNAFHCSCLCAEVRRLTPPAQARRVQQLQHRLAQVPEESGIAPAWQGLPAVPTQTLKKQLEDEVGVEDPYCGDLVVRNIDLPFLHVTAESAEVHSWEI